MEKTQLIRQIYVYALLLTSIIMLMVNSVTTVNSLIDIVYPNPYTMTYEEYTSSKGYTPSLPARPIEAPTITTPVITNSISSKPTREEYQEYIQDQNTRESREATKRTLKSSLWIIASIILLLYALHEKRLLKNEGRS